MIPLEQAKNLKYGDVLVTNKNSLQPNKRWRVNGKVKTWKRDASKVKVPVKHGLYSYDYITEDILHTLDFENEDVADTRAHSESE